MSIVSVQYLIWWCIKLELRSDYQGQGSSFSSCWSLSPVTPSLGGRRGSRERACPKSWSEIPKCTQVFLTSKSLKRTFFKHWLACLTLNSIHSLFQVTRLTVILTQCYVNSCCVKVWLCLFNSAVLYTSFPFNPLLDARMARWLLESFFAACRFSCAVSSSSSNDIIHRQCHHSYRCCGKLLTKAAFRSH